jgi:hypothetical protein
MCHNFAVLYLLSYNLIGILLQVNFTILSFADWALPALLCQGKAESGQCKQQLTYQMFWCVIRFRPDFLATCAENSADVQIILSVKALHKKLVFFSSFTPGLLQVVD